MVHLTRGTNSCSSGNAKPLKEEVKEGASTANPKSSMNPTEGFTPQCQFPKHPSIKPCRIKLDPKRDIKGQTPMRYSTAGPGSKGQWWSSLTEQAIFQSSLQLVYSLSYFDTTPVFCTSLEASTAQQMAECLHNKCSQGSACGSACGDCCRWDRRGGRDPLLGQQHSHQSQTLLEKHPTP